MIRNDSPRTLDGVKAVLRVDDKPTELTLPQIAPHSTARMPLSVAFPGSGPHEFSLQLAEDALPGDDQRWSAVAVKDSLLIRLVDGEPSTEPFGSEVDYLAAPLSIGVGAAEAWRVEVVPDQDFLSQRLEPPDVLVLANVAAPTPEQADRLNQLTRAGMGLMIFTGSKLDVGLYNDLLYRPESRLLPFPMKSLVDASITRPDRRAGSAVAPGEVDGAEAVGPGADRGPADHDGRRGTVGERERQGRGAGPGPLERPGPLAGGRPARGRRRAGLALDDHRRPRGQRLADRAELRPGRPGSRSRIGPADPARQHGYGRRRESVG